MAVDNINFFGNLYGYDSFSTGNYTSSAMQGLDRDVFLRLMVAQFANQDPMSPVSETESIAQLAQFSTLEQMTNMVDSIMDLKVGIALMLNQSLISQGSSMIGKEVTGTIYDENGVEREITGVVSSVHMKNGFLTLKIGDEELPIDFVKEIRNSAQ
ncbi:MAG: flagellar biosynthesis protein FlgD [Peptococcaceae bacterium]|nr:flagellar biosynthesis protein FlgD [Peptococcaceae bacterium]MDR2736332.1 flagellar biosynthesis protein FlgD [Gracilibacteraceae bacterium]